MDDITQALDPHEPNDEQEKDNGAEDSPTGICPECKMGHHGHRAYCSQSTHAQRGFKQEGDPGPGTLARDLGAK